MPLPLAPRRNRAASAPASGPASASTTASATAPSPFLNAVTLMTGQALGLLVPLATIPYLARVLGPDRWGPVITAQAFGNWLLLLFEFGFELSATRAVARARIDPDQIDGIVHGVQSAKLLLMAFTVPIVIALLAVLPGVRTQMPLFAFALAFAVLRGSSPLWFFQGIERVKAAVTVDTVTRAIAALGVFVFVRTPADGVRVLILQTALSAVALAILSFWLYRHVELRTPSVRAGVAMLREAFGLFATRAWISLYITGNTLILSAMAGPAVVAVFGGAERIVRSAVNLLIPITAAYMPRVSYLHTTDRGEAEKLVRQLLAGVGLFGLVMTITALAGAPLLVTILLGSQYGASVPVVRMLSPLPVLSAINTVLGLYWALPFGHERPFLVTIAFAGIADVALALLLVPHWGALGMAGAAIGAEVVVFGMLFVLWRKHT